MRESSKNKIMAALRPVTAEFFTTFDNAYFTKRPELFLKLTHAIARFRDAKLGFAVKDAPGVYFTAKTIKEREEIVIHLRAPIIDKQHGNLVDYLDIDIYMPKKEIYKLVDFVEHPEKYEGGEVLSL